VVCRAKEVKRKIRRGNWRGRGERRGYPEEVDKNPTDLRALPLPL
jgi:hypothetical protein